MSIIKDCKNTTTIFDTGKYVLLDDYMKLFKLLEDVNSAYNDSNRIYIDWIPTGELIEVFRRVDFEIKKVKSLL